MRLILFSLLILVQAFNVSALDTRETYQFKLLRMQSPHIMTINRGLEDGIENGDHIKIFHERTFISRAVAITVNMKTSHWRIYHNFSPKSIDLEKNYKLLCINNIPIPISIGEAILNTEISEDPDIRQEKNKINESKRLKEKFSKTGMNKYTPIDNLNDMKKVLNSRQLKSDFQKNKLRIYASPFKLSKHNHKKDISYGVQFQNERLSKFQLDSQFTYDSSVIEDPLKNTSNKFSDYRLSNIFRINRIYKNWSALALLNYRKSRIGAIYAYKSQWEFSPLGIQYDIGPRDKEAKFILSYSPIIVKQTLQSYDEFGSVIDNEQSKIRHGFRLLGRINPREHIFIQNEFLFKPAFFFDPNDSDLRNTFTLTYKPTAISLSYMNRYIWDKQLENTSGLPSTNIIHMLVAGIDWDI